MSLGSCGNSNGTCIYISDTGDNLARATVGTESERQQAYRILKIKEPDWRIFPEDSMLPATEVEVLEFDYLHPSSPTTVADSEATFMDHTGWGAGESIGDLYVVTKWDNRAKYTYPRVFYIPVSAWGTGTTYSPAAIGNGTALLGGRWTRADMSDDGTLIAVGDVNKTQLFTRCPGMSVETALAGVEPCYTWNNPVAGQMESFAWSSDGTRNIQIAEGSQPPMAWTTMVYDTTNSVYCPDNEAVFEASGPAPSSVAVSQKNNTMAPVANTTFTPTTTPESEQSLIPTETTDENDMTPSPSLIESGRTTSLPSFSITPSASITSIAEEEGAPSLGPAPVLRATPPPTEGGPTSGSLSRCSLLAFSFVIALVLSTLYSV